MSARSKKVTLGLSFGVLGLIVVAGLTVAGVVAMRDAGVLPDRQVPGAVDGGVNAGQSEISDAGCAGQLVVLEGTVAEAPTTEWDYLGRVAVPSSPEAGPAEAAADGFPSCFAHTPTGALFAAANLTVVSSTPELAKAHAEQMFADDARKAATVQRIQDAAPSQAQALSLAGFRVLDYDGDTATIDTAWRVGPTLLASTVMELRWEGGDWLVVPPAEDAAAIVQLPNLGGYIPWNAP